MQVDICGVPYKIFYETAEENPKFDACDCFGYCELYAKEIHIQRQSFNPKNFKRIDKFECKVLRHEIIHALLYEGGITDYFEDERLVDTFAILYPKLEKIIDDATTIFESERKSRDDKENHLCQLKIVENEHSLKPVQ